MQTETGAWRWSRLLAAPASRGARGHMRSTPITLASNQSDAALEAAQALRWRPIADAWPAVESPPLVRLVTIDGLARDPLLAAGSVALIDAAGAEFATLAHVADSLTERHIPAVLMLGDDVSLAHAERIASESVFLAGAEEDPRTLAVMLHTLARRQPAVEAATQELSMSRRFSNGLRAQMERVSEELMLASFVQRDFLPKSTPCFGGLDFGVLFRPAGYVSGDIYDLQRLDEHHAGFFIADVIGHGVPAALLTMVIQKSLPTKEISGSTYRLVPPAEALTRLNIELIRQQGESARFASALYGMIDVRDRTITLAGAGHPSPVCFDATGATRRIETPGGLLGVFADEVYQQTTFTLGDDETMLLYTDGFDTAFPDPGADALGRRMPTAHYLGQFAELAADARAGAPLEDAMQALAHRLDQQPGSLHQIDDLTAIAMTCDPRRARGPRATPEAASLSR